MSKLLSANENKWLRQCASYLGVSVPNVRRDDSVYDIAYSNNTILLGKKYMAEPKDSFLHRQKLFHETLHHTGHPWGHNNWTRKQGYYSKPEKDELSREMVSVITAYNQGGHMKGNPLNTPYGIFMANYLRAQKQQGKIHTMEDSQNAMREGAQIWRSQHGHSNPLTFGTSNQAGTPAGIHSGFHFNPSRKKHNPIRHGKKHIEYGAEDDWDDSPQRRSYGADTMDFRRRQAEMDVIAREEAYKRTREQYGDEHGMTQMALRALLSAENKALKYMNPSGVGATVATCPNCSSKIAVPDGVVGGQCTVCGGSINTLNPAIFKHHGIEKVLIPVLLLGVLKLVSGRSIVHA